MYEQIQDRIRFIRSRIAEAAQKVSKKPEDIMLVGATKTVPANIISQVSHMLDAVGENRVQELLTKWRENAYSSNIPLHFIGHLQSNKVSQIAGKVQLIHSVDTFKLASIISEFMTKQNQIQDVLIEVNLAQESSKSGVFPERVQQLLQQVDSLPGIRVRGLMAIPPKTASPKEAHRYFCVLNQLFVDISLKKYDNIHADFLSVGMSGDYYEAILEGANVIRIGQAIFGERI